MSIQWILSILLYLMNIYPGNSVKLSSFQISVQYTSIPHTHCDLQKLQIRFPNGLVKHVPLSECSKFIFSAHLFTHNDGLKESITNRCFYQNEDASSNYMVSLNLHGRLINGIITINETVLEIPDQHISANGQLSFDSTSPVTSFLAQPFATYNINKQLLKRKKRDITISDYGNQERQLYTKVILVVDSIAYTSSFKKNLTAAHLYGVNVINYLNAFYRQVGLHVILMKLDIWTKQPSSIPDYSIKPDLGSFRTYTADTYNVIPNDKYDNAQYIISYVDGLNSGVAYIAGVCSSNAVAYNQFTSDVFRVALVMAHEMGHNLGLNHLNLTIHPCPSGNSCIMESTSGYGPIYGWSNFSLDALKTILETNGPPHCLKNKPKMMDQSLSSVCGNGVIEDGEDCDDGMTPGVLAVLNYNASSPCCNLTSCLFLPNAKCSSGRCCDRSKCQLRPKGDVCSLRVPIKECDLPEYCDGVSEKCPADLYMADSTPCPEDNTKNCQSATCSSKPKNQVLPDYCTCSDFGVCNNLLQCHCVTGRGGDTCETVGCGGSPNSGPPCLAREDAKVIGIMVLVLIVLFGVMAIVFFFGLRSGKLVMNPESVMPHRKPTRPPPPSILTIAYPPIEYDKRSKNGKLKETNKLNNLLANQQVRAGASQRNEPVSTTPRIPPTTTNIKPSKGHRPPPPPPPSVPLSTAQNKYVVPQATATASQNSESYVNLPAAIPDESQYVNLSVKERAKQLLQESPNNSLNAKTGHKKPAVERPKKSKTPSDRLQISDPVLLETTVSQPVSHSNSIRSDAQSNNDAGIYENIPGDALYENLSHP